MQFKRFFVFPLFLSLRFRCRSNHQKFETAHLERKEESEQLRGSFAAIAGKNTGSSGRCDDSQRQEACLGSRQKQRERFEGRGDKTPGTACRFLIVIDTALALIKAAHWPCCLPPWEGVCVCMQAGWGYILCSSPISLHFPSSTAPTVNFLFDKSLALETRVLFEPINLKTRTLTRSHKILSFALPPLTLFFPSVIQML